MSIIHITIFPWQLTNLWIAASDEGICRIEFERTQDFAAFSGSFASATIVQEKNSHLQNFSDELSAYFAGEKLTFCTPVDFLTGTEFQKSVWQQVAVIPYGQIVTYGQIAKKLDNVGASRAVGAANGANPVPILVPCHRVVQSNGKLGGYSGGLDIKDTLLRLEGVLF